ncbi:hypothetical protein [Metabacillus idriensis]|uniref:hypothetical protein n=1 Tax=Metabacillus idriensis TaxID=324768 RepID=UPI00174E5941|nr:hypothetical protein [Metabacillus idriensis]
MRKQFDTCSYSELTNCVKGRIEGIREYRRFLNDDSVKSYSRIRAKVALSITIEKFEIQRLLKMRRVLKKSGQRHWNSDKLSIQGGE